jgi:hypothetical protein
VRRRVLAAALMTAVLAAIHSSTALAATPPSLWSALQQTDALTARLDGVRVQLRAARVDIRRNALSLERASERVARLQAQGGTLRYASRGGRPGQHWLHHPRLVPTPTYRAAVTALKQAQREAAATDGFPRLAAAQRRVDRLLAARRRERALAEALSGAPVTATAVPGEQTREQWATALLRAVDAPVCGNNLVSLVTWQTAENTTAAWNPLATTQPAPGTTDYNSVGVKNYPSSAAGIAATVATLRGGYVTQGYGWILYRLVTCADPAVTAAAIKQSNWCHGCAGGAYVTGMVNEVRADYAAYAAG